MLIIAVALEAQLATLVTSAGTLVLGLSWLIGGALSDVLNSIIFLFIKHPYDVGDRVIINNLVYTVKEVRMPPLSLLIGPNHQFKIRLLSTIFLDSNGAYVQAPKYVLHCYRS